MKISFECPECLIHRGYIEIQKATKDSKLRKRAMIAVIKEISNNLNETSVPSYIGTKRDRLIRSITQNPDPFRVDKNISNKKALEFLPLVEKFLADEKEDLSRFRKACLASIVGNSIEFGILGYQFQYKEILNEIINTESKLAIDDINETANKISGLDNILFLTDNAGEIVLDKLLIKEIKSFGTKVTVAVKNSPVSNDATLEDAIVAGIDKVADKLMTTGSDALGYIPAYCSKEFLEVYNMSDFVISKGMAHLETFTEHIPSPPRIILLRAKCKPVANYLKVKLNQNVAKLFK